PESLSTDHRSDLSAGAVGPCKVSGFAAPSPTRHGEPRESWLGSGSPGWRSTEARRTSLPGNPTDQARGVRAKPSRSVPSRGAPPPGVRSEPDINHKYFLK